MEQENGYLQVQQKKQRRREPVFKKEQAEKKSERVSSEQIRNRLRQDMQSHLKQAKEEQKVQTKGESQEKRGKNKRQLQKQRREEEQRKAQMQRIIKQNAQKFRLMDQQEQKAKIHLQTPPDKPKESAMLPKPREEQLRKQELEREMAERHEAFVRQEERKNAQIRDQLERKNRYESQAIQNQKRMLKMKQLNIENERRLIEEEKRKIEQERLKLDEEKRQQQQARRREEEERQRILSQLELKQKEINRKIMSQAEKKESSKIVYHESQPVVTKPKLSQLPKKSLVQSKHVTASHASVVNRSKEERLRVPELFDFDPFELVLACYQTSFIHKGIKCSSCKVKPFVGMRLSCLICKDYSSCSLCFNQSESHAASHPMVVCCNELSGRGQKRLQDMKRLYNQGAQGQQIVYKSFCHNCSQKKGEIHSLFFINLRNGARTCMDCVKADGASRFITNLIPVSWDFSLEDFRVEESERLKKAVHKSSGKQFLLNTVEIQIQNKQSYYAARNQLSKFKGNNLLNLYAHKEQVLSHKTIRLHLLEEFMPNRSLTDLISSKNFATFSIRRKMGIFRSLTSAIANIHNLQLFHSNLSPDIILLDKFHQVRIQLLPFVNRAAQTTFEYDISYIQINDDQIDQFTDVFSLGLIIYLILTGEKPKYSKGQVQIKNTKVFQKLILKCVERDRRCRPTARLVEEQLQRFDEFFWEFVSRKYERKAYQSYETRKKDSIFLQAYQQFRWRI